MLGNLVGSPSRQDVEPRHRPCTHLVDNKSAISLYKNPVLHDRRKHIDLRYHFIRDCVEKGTVVVEFIKTGEQKADILTKVLGRVRFQELRDKIGIVNIQTPTTGLRGRMLFSTQSPRKLFSKQPQGSRITCTWQDKMAGIY
jgi:hypothetical protein